MKEFEADMRLRDMGASLALAAAIFGKEDVLRAYLREELKRRQAQRGEGYYGELVQVLGDAFRGFEPVITLAKIHILLKVAKGAVMGPEDKVAMETDESEEVPSRKGIGSMLRKLGFELESKHGERGNVTWIVGLDLKDGKRPDTPAKSLLESLITEYGVTA